MSRPAAASDPPVDLEKGLKAAATDEEEEEEELAVVYPRLATRIKATVDVVVAAYTLFIIGVIVSAVKVSNNWWDPWRSFLVCSAALLLTLWGTPTVKDALVKKYATKHTPASDNSGVITELLVAMLP